MEGEACAGEAASRLSAERFERKQAAKEAKAEKRNKKMEKLQEQSEEAVAARLPDWATYVERYDGQEGLRPFSDLKNAESDERSGRFIAEGPETLILLLRSQIEVVSLLVKAAVLERITPAIEDYAARTGSRPEVFVMHKARMEQVVGYSVERGALGCGVKPEERDVDWVTGTLVPRLRSEGTCVRVLAIEKSFDAANLGGMIRTARAFGIHFVLLGEGSCDVWYRRAVRCSMGHLFKMPVVRVPSMADALRALQASEITSYAAVIDLEAPALGGMTKVGGAAGWCVLMGNEDSGVSDDCMRACESAVRILMHPEVDSLNVGVACGVLLNGFMEREGR